jgi:hypothetical protein
MENITCMSMSRHQNARQNHIIKTANRLFENVARLKHMRTIATNGNFIHDEINSRLNSGSACYHSVQNLFSSCPLSKNTKIKIYKTATLAVLLYKCETSSLS